VVNNTLCKKSLWKSVGEYDVTLKEAFDLELYIRFVKNGYMPIYSPLHSHIHRFYNSNQTQKIQDFQHGCKPNYMQDILKLHPELNKFIAKK